MKHFNTLLKEAEDFSINDSLFRDKYITVLFSKHGFERYQQRTDGETMTLPILKKMVKTASTSIKNMPAGTTNLYFSKSTRFGFIIGRRTKSPTYKIITFLPKKPEGEIPFAKGDTKFVMTESNNLRVDEIVYID